jgi:hypothetical protein
VKQVQGEGLSALDHNAKTHRLFLGWCFRLVFFMEEEKKEKAKNCCFMPTDT